jgi:hypothetical protein
LLREVAVDLVDDVILLDDELQGENIASGVNALVGARAANETRLLGVVGVGLGDGAGLDEGGEQVALDGLLLMVDLQAVVASTCVADHHGDLALGLALLGGNLLGGESDAHVAGSLMLLGNDLPPLLRSVLVGLVSLLFGEDSPGGCSVSVGGGIASMRVLLPEQWGRGKVIKA